MQYTLNSGRYLSRKDIPKFREKLFDKQNGRCYWCNQPMTLFHFVRKSLFKETTNAATLEHLKDRLSIGGRSNNPEDIVCSCAECNNLRNKTREKLLRKSINDYCSENIEMKKIRHMKTIEEWVKILDNLGLYPLKD